jgi:hypothetical protein
MTHDAGERARGSREVEEDIDLSIGLSPDRFPYFRW